MSADCNAWLTVLPAGTVIVRVSPSAVTLTVISASLTCGERQPTSNVSASKRVGRDRWRGKRCITSGATQPEAVIRCIIRALPNTTGDRHDTVSDGNAVDSQAGRHRAER